MTRRNLIRALGMSAVTAMAGISGQGCRAKEREGSAASLPFQVALVPCPNYEPERLLDAVRNGWKSTRPPDVRAKRVVIKPNIADFAPDRPIHTDHRLVEALIVHLRDIGAGEVIVAEGPPQNRDAEWIFHQSGFEVMAKRRGVPLIDLNYDDIQPVKNANPRATLLRELYLPETILSADVIVSVAKMKTHKLAGITLSLKNMFGIVPGMKYGWPKNTLHWNGIPLSICEINGTVKTHYSIVDGIVGMEGHGPIMGTAKMAGVLVMGSNALSVDATAARVMGIDPARVEYLAMAYKVELGSLRQDDISVSGEKIGRVRTEFALQPDFAFLRDPSSS